MSENILATFIKTPFELLRQMDSRARNASVKSERSQLEWVGVGASIDSINYVIPQDQVLEVLRLPATTRVPGSRRWMIGLSNVRGTLFPVIDVRLFCGEHPSVIGRDSRIVLIKLESTPVAVVVDKVFGFRRFPAKTMSSEIPSSVPLREHVAGIFDQDDNSWAILDVASLITGTDGLGLTH